MIPTHSFRRLERTLTQTTQELDHSHLHKSIERTERMTRIARAKVIRPANQKLIQPANSTNVPKSTHGLSHAPHTSPSSTESDSNNDDYDREGLCRNGTNTPENPAFRRVAPLAPPLFYHDYTEAV
jgi:6-pyruvoyl-tetrahydropterin synthase